ncbi:MAG: hypothetical protein QW594_03400 [Candidatus Woesearchaeota archaeon]
MQAHKGKTPHVRNALIIFFLGAIFFVVLLLLRFFKGHPLLLGDWSYFHLKAASDFPLLVEQGKATLFDFCLYVFSYLGNFSLLSIVFSLFLAFLIGGLFLLILHDLNQDAAMPYTMLLLFSSPVFLSVALVPSSFAFALVLHLSFFVLLLRRSYWALPLSLLLLFMSVLDAILVMLVLLVFAFGVSSLQERQAFFSRFKIVGVVAFLYYSLYALVFHTLPFGYSLSSIPTSMSFFFGNQVMLSIGVFVLLLAVMGLGALYRQYRYAFFVLLSFFLLFWIAHFFSFDLLPYAHFILLYLAGLGFYSLVALRWYFQELRQLTLFTLFCGLLFSALFYGQSLVGAQPRQELVDALHWLQERPQGKVLTDPQYGFWVEFCSNHPVYCTPASCTMDVYTRMLTSRDLREVQKLFDEHQITYLVFVPAMREKGLWKEEDDGIFFLIAHSHVFKQLYAKQGILIYQYLPDS